MKVSGEDTTAMALRGRIAVVVTIGALLTIPALGAAPAAASPGNLEQSLVSFHNDFRVQNGLAPLRVSAELTSLARRYSNRMAEVGDVWHMPSLATDVHGWADLGDNVGMSTSLGRLERAFMASPTHRDNILCAPYTLIGAGIVASGSEIYATIIFMRPAAAKPTAHRVTRPKPRPAPPPLPETAVEMLLQLAGMDSDLA